MVVHIAALFSFTYHEMIHFHGKTNGGKGMDFFPRKRFTSNNQQWRKTGEDNAACQKPKTLITRIVQRIAAMMKHT